jgi:hypothetical protein
MPGTATIGWMGNTAPTGLVVVSSDTKTGAGNALAAHALTGVAAGAVLIVTTAIDFSGGTATITSSPSLTWTNRTDANSNEIYTAIFTAGGSINVTTTWNDASTASSVCTIVTGQEGTLGGAALSVQEGDAPGFGDPVSGTITTTRNNSIVFGVIGDRNGVAGTVAYIGTPTQIFENRPGGFSSWHFYKTTTTAGALNQGLTAPSGGAAQSMGLYEIRTP